MKYQLTLILCLSPIVIIYIVMKLTMLLSQLKRNPIMSEKNPLENEDPIWQDAYADVDAEEEEYGDRTDYR